MIGFDFNGVVDKGIHPTKHDVVITALGPESSGLVFKYFKKHNLYCPIYFNPFKDSVAWKLNMITWLKLPKYYENDPVTAEFLASNSDCEIILVK